MNKSEKYRRSVLANGVVICIVTAIICSLAIPGSVAKQTGDTVTVNAPEQVNAGETFDVSIDVANITDFNSAQFDLSFDSSVLNVTGVTDGSLDGTTIPVSTWEHVDADTVKVLVSMPMGEGVSGTGYLAKISFDVVGKTGNRSELNISGGLLVDKEAAEIPALWIDDEVVIGPVSVMVKVNAPERVKTGETFDATIDVANITEFNSAEFDLSFDSSVVNITGVVDGSLNGTAIPISTWEFVDADTVRVLVSMPMGEGVSGSGYLAKVNFDVVGETGNRSVLDISNGLLANKDADEIIALWTDDEVVIGDASA
nr:hypothetical secreted protein [uncultured archaeon]CBH39726.1 hypothetical secreted protein [uncultured archaeon]